VDAAVGMLREEQGRAIRPGDAIVTNGVSAAGDRRALRALVSRLYHERRQTRLDAAEELGRLARADPDRVVGLLPRLLWTLNDESGSRCPGAPVAIARIALAQPQRALGFVQPLMHFLDDEAYLPEVLSAVALLAGAFPEVFRSAAPIIRQLRSHPDGRVRELADAALRAGGDQP
jgi:hypothetical protein